MQMTTEVQKGLLLANIVVATLSAPSFEVFAQTTSENGGYVFNGNRVVSNRDPRQSISIKEQLSIFDIAQRFSSSQVKASTECDGYCLIVTGNGGALEIYYEDDNKTISGIVSRETSSRDVAGNKIGSALSRAIGSNKAHCDVAESTYCDSQRIKGLSYVPGETEKCSLGTADKKDTFTIPDCATIEGFAIWNPK